MMSEIVILVVFSDGDYGTQEFESEVEAAEFIVQRMQADPRCTIDDYVVYKAQKLFAKPIEVVSKVQISSTE